jgi:hypothetical protein
MQHNRFSPKLFFQLLLLGGILVTALNVQYILDQYALATFHPSPEVSAIIDRINLTPTSMRILARTRPQIDDKATFNRDCQTSKGELELGCFVNGRIYVLRIENPSLAPEMDVVLAHEVLHAAYDRLGQGRKSTVDMDLEAVFSKITDSDLKQRMADYAKTEPGQQDNELHSILGTEYATLNPSLETYYAQYFQNRAIIVAAQKSYQNVFENSRKALDAELSAIHALKAQLNTLNRRMESLKASGNIPAYNSLVPQQNQLVDTINKRIGLYQQAVEEYNALSKSLDSQQITAPSESTVR